VATRKPDPTTDDGRGFGTGGRMVGQAGRLILLLNLQKKVNLPEIQREVPTWQMAISLIFIQTKRTSNP
jgi:hypothetical protein